MKLARISSDEVLELIREAGPEGLSTIELRRLFIDAPRLNIYPHLERLRCKLQIQKADFQREGCTVYVRTQPPTLFERQHIEDGSSFYL